MNGSAQSLERGFAMALFLFMVSMACAEPYGTELPTSPPEPCRLAWATGETEVSVDLEPTFTSTGPTSWSGEFVNNGGTVCRLAASEGPGVELRMPPALGPGELGMASVLVSRTRAGAIATWVEIRDSEMARSLRADLAGVVDEPRVEWVVETHAPDDWVACFSHVDFQVWNPTQVGFEVALDLQREPSLNSYFNDYLRRGFGPIWLEPGEAKLWSGEMLISSPLSLEVPLILTAMNGETADGGHYPFRLWFTDHGYRQLEASYDEPHRSGGRSAQLDITRCTELIGPPVDALGREVDDYAWDDFRSENGFEDICHVWATRDSGEYPRPWTFTYDGFLPCRDGE